MKIMLRWRDRFESDLDVVACVTFATAVAKIQQIRREDLSDEKMKLVERLLVHGSDTIGSQSKDPSLAQLAIRKFWDAQPVSCR